MNYGKEKKKGKKLIESNEQPTSALGETHPTINKGAVGTRVLHVDL